MKGKYAIKDYLFVIMTMLLIFLILLCTTQTVMSQSRRADGVQKQYYADIEQEYLYDMEKLLCEKGYKCSGITIRWVSDIGGLRNYTIMIHHRKINSLNSYEKAKLIHELSMTEFKAEGCTFNYEFISTNI